MGVIEQLQAQVRDQALKIEKLEAAVAKLMQDRQSGQFGFLHLTDLQRKYKITKYAAQGILKEGREKGRIKVVVHKMKSGATMQLIDEYSFYKYLSNPA